MRQPFIAGNWKMNTTAAEAEKLVLELRKELDMVRNLEKVLCPPFISLITVKQLITATSLKIGAQNMFFEEKGAYTGEISALMLAGVCDYVILGHSERRQYFNETNQIVSKKVAVAIKHGLKPILCVGEVLSEYESGRTREVVAKQVYDSLAGVPYTDSLTIAYEPVWAIGTGRAATGPAANDTIGFIRSLVAKKYSSAAAANMRILYGGSVTAANIAEFVSQAEIDGGLVGGASLKAAEFVSIVKKTAEIRNA
jgi:triosephosphate isomerase (TIM)